MADIKKEKEEIEYDEEDYDEEFSDEDDDIQMVDPTKEHPLEREWAVYYDAELLFKQPANRENPQWGANISQLFVFNTVENFWRMIHNLPLGSAIRAGTAYYLFQKGVGPTWEALPNGGKWFWSIPLPTEHTSSGCNIVDFSWQVLSCLMIGEQFGKYGLVGLVCQNKSKKEGFRFSFWTNNKDEENMLALGKLIKKHISEDILDKLDSDLLGRLKVLYGKNATIKDKDSGWNLIFNSFKGDKVSLTL